MKALPQWGLRWGDLWISLVGLPHPSLHGRFRPEDLKIACVYALAKRETLESDPASVLALFCDSKHSAYPSGPQASPSAE